MNKRSFFLGILTGAFLTFVGIVVFGLIKNSATNGNPIKYLDNPVSYENKAESAFKIIQVYPGAALAIERSGWSGTGIAIYTGNTVLLIGRDFYNDQIVTVMNPQRVGSYSYTTRNDMPMTVPVITGEIY